MVGVGGTRKRKEKKIIRAWSFILNSHRGLLSKGKESVSVGLGYKAFHHKVAASNVIPPQGITKTCSETTAMGVLNI